MYETITSMAPTRGVATVAINILTQAVKKWVWPRWGKTGVQVVVAMLALIGAAYVTYSKLFPSLEIFVTSAIALFALAITLFEVIWSKIRLPESNDPDMKNIFQDPGIYEGHSGGGGGQIG